MALVGSILADLVVEKAMERACEPGVIWEGIAKVVEGVAARGKSVDRGDDRTTRNGGWQATFWMVLQFAFLAFAAVRALVIAVATSSSLPHRGVRLSKSATSPTTAIGPTPVLGMKMWGFLARQVELEERMPWAYGALALGQWLMLYGPGRVGAVDGVVDRYVWLFCFIQSTFSFCSILFAARSCVLFRPLLRCSRDDPPFRPCILSLPRFHNLFRGRCGIPTQLSPIPPSSSQSLHPNHPYYHLLAKIGRAHV